MSISFCFKERQLLEQSMTQRLIESGDIEEPYILDQLLLGMGSTVNTAEEQQSEEASWIPSPSESDAMEEQSTIQQLLEMQLTDKYKVRPGAC